MKIVIEKNKVSDLSMIWIYEGKPLLGINFQCGVGPVESQYQEVNKELTEIYFKRAKGCGDDFNKDTIFLEAIQEYSLRTDKQYRDNYIKEKIKESFNDLIRTLSYDIRGVEYIRDEIDIETIESISSYIYNRIDQMDTKYVASKKDN